VDCGFGVVGVCGVVFKGDAAGDVGNPASDLERLGKYESLYVDENPAYNYDG
jgi:predicted histidine transporter YuiF (NhaC family)